MVVTGGKGGGSDYLASAVVVVREVTPGLCTVNLQYKTVERRRKMYGCGWLLLAPLSDPLSEFGDMQLGWLVDFQL